MFNRVIMLLIGVFFCCASACAMEPELVRPAGKPVHKHRRVSAPDANLSAQTAITLCATAKMRKAAKLALAKEPGRSCLRGTRSSLSTRADELPAAAAPRAAEPVARPVSPGLGAMVDALTTPPQASRHRQRSYSVDELDVREIFEAVITQEVHRRARQTRPVPEGSCCCVVS